MALFAVTTFVIFRFALDRTGLEGGLAAGVLVTTLLFAAILAINRLFVAERDEGGFELIRLSPIDRTVLFAAKSSALFIYLCVARAASRCPIFALFFLDSGAATAAPDPGPAARQPGPGGHGHADLDDRDDVHARATCSRR